MKDINIKIYFSDDDFIERKTTIGALRNYLTGKPILPTYFNKNVEVYSRDFIKKVEFTKKVAEDLKGV